MKTLESVIPHFFEDRLIISLSKEWVDIFGKIPEFKVFIDSKNRLTLQSKEIQKTVSENSLSEHKKVEILV